MAARPISQALMVYRDSKPNRLSAQQIEVAYRRLVPLVRVSVGTPPPPDGARQQPPSARPNARANT